MVHEPRIDPEYSAPAHLKGTKSLLSGLAAELAFAITEV
jgi:hypothetical protein